MIKLLTEQENFALVASDAFVIMRLPYAKSDAGGAVALGLSGFTETLGGDIMNLDEAIRVMTQEIVAVLGGTTLSMYLYGSACLGDFRLGWSDIDILVLTDKEMTEQQAEKLLLLRQILVERYEGNSLFRSFEGAILPVEVFLQEKPWAFGVLGDQRTTIDRRI